jgi:hypothetical protein
MALGPFLPATSRQSEPATRLTCPDASGSLGPHSDMTIFQKLTDQQGSQQMYVQLPVSISPFQRVAPYCQDGLSAPSLVRPGFNSCCNPFCRQTLLLQTAGWMVSLAKSSQDKSVCTIVMEIPRIPQEGQS